MANQLLLNENLKNFIEKLDIDKEQKDALIFKIPNLDKEERLKLLATLGEIYLLDSEEKEILEKLKAGWQQ